MLNVWIAKTYWKTSDAVLVEKYFGSLFNNFRDYLILVNNERAILDEAIRLDEKEKKEV